MPAGRPTDYGEDVKTKAINYIESCEDESKSFVKEHGDGYIKYEEKLIVNIPTIEGLARYLKIHRSTLYAWQKQYEEFSDIIEELQQKQAERLLSNGLSGTYNSTIAKVLLTKHGYNDKTEIDQKTTVKDERIDDSKFTDEELRILAELQRKGRISPQEGI